jgi:hypothetical protein
VERKERGEEGERERERDRNTNKNKKNKSETILKDNKSLQLISPSLCEKAMVMAAKNKKPSNHYAYQVAILPNSFCFFIVAAK